MCLPSRAVPAVEQQGTRVDVPRDLIASKNACRLLEKRWRGSCNQSRRDPSSLFPSAKIGSPEMRNIDGSEGAVRGLLRIVLPAVVLLASACGAPATKEKVLGKDPAVIEGGNTNTGPA